MRSRPRAAFVVTVSLLGSVAAAGCGKESTSECKPPDCHINPPPPQPTPTMHTMNPPAFQPDASVTDEPSRRPPTRNPPPVLLDAGKLPPAPEKN